MFGIIILVFSLAFDTWFTPNFDSSGRISQLFSLYSLLFPFTYFFSLLSLFQLFWFLSDFRSLGAVLPRIKSSLRFFLSLFILSIDDLIYSLVSVITCMLMTHWACPNLSWTPDHIYKCLIVFFTSLTHRHLKHNMCQIKPTFRFPTPFPKAVLPLHHPLSHPGQESLSHHLPLFFPLLATPHKSLNSVVSTS